MKTELPKQSDGRAAVPMGTSASVACRPGAPRLQEAREALPPTISFFVGFNFVVLTTNLLLADYVSRRRCGLHPPT